MTFKSEQQGSDSGSSYSNGLTSDIPSVKKLISNI